MASKSKSGKWVVRWQDAGRHRGKAFTRREDAERFEAEVRRRRELGEMVLTRADVPTLREEAVSWLKRKDGTVRPRTLRLYADALDKHILPDLGDANLLDLRPRLLEEWQDGLHSGPEDKRPGTRMAQISRSVLSQILDRAVAHDLLASNPLSKVEGPRHKSKDVEPATVEQVETMRAWFLAAEKPSEAALISVLAYVGLRPPQEPMGWMWSDLDGPRALVRRRNLGGELVPGLKKGRKQRRVEVPDPVRAELAALHLTRRRRPGLVFPRRDGNPWTSTDWNNWTQRRFWPARDEAGLPKTFTPYDLRHTCASLMIAAGRPPTEVAEQLGHSLQTSVSTYQHVIDEMVGQPIRPLADLISEARQTLTGS